MCVTLYSISGFSPNVHYWDGPGRSINCCDEEDKAFSV